MKSLLKYWLPLLIWLGVIFFDSTDAMSAQHTSRFIVPFLLWLNPNLSADAVTIVHFIVRKCAHAAEYAILAFLLFRAAVCMMSSKLPKPVRYVAVWSICLFVAATDEFHQTFVQSRGPSIRDVAIDCIGAILGLFIGAVLARKRSKKPGRTRARIMNVS